MKDHDITIIGGGIVGLATALELLGQGRDRIVVLEAEPGLARHQTGHNSGVIHSGLYYKPGSLKARYCVEGRAALCRFCEENGVPYETCGKLVVATSEAERSMLRELERRAHANGLTGVRRLTLEEMREREPEVGGLEGLLVQETGIVDYTSVAEAYARVIRARGGEIGTGAKVLGIHRDHNGFVLATTSGEWRTGHLINCAGLYSDHIARLAGLNPDIRIIPFRGQYVALTPSAERLVAHLIYPVPDPRFPFLGVHFTRMIGGGVEAGPNAVLTFRRNWYAAGDDPARDLRVFAYSGFWRMALRYGKTGLEEVWRSRSLAALATSLQRLVPSVTAADLRPHGSGIRAQAVGLDGRLLDDFHFIQAPRQVHVLNAPSPAATASLRIGRAIADKAIHHFR